MTKRELIAAIRTHCAGVAVETATGPQRLDMTITYYGGDGEQDGLFIRTTDGTQFRVVVAAEPAKR